MQKFYGPAGCPSCRQTKFQQSQTSEGLI